MSVTGEVMRSCGVCGWYGTAEECGICKLIAAAVAAEREACAQIAERMCFGVDSFEVPAAISARSKDALKGTRHNTGTDQENECPTKTPS